jgi:hypothetical protein
MTEKEFLNWLRGFFELANPTKLNAEQLALIKEKLQRVVSSETAA